MIDFSARLRAFNYFFAFPVFSLLRSVALVRLVVVMDSLGFYYK